MSNLNTKRGFGGVGIIIIILLVLGFGFYFWSQKSTPMAPSPISNTKPTLSVFNQIKFTDPESCPGKCSIDGRFWIDNPPVAAIEGNYGVVVLNTHPANTYVDQYLILISDINSQPKQISDVSINIEESHERITVKDINILNKLVTVNVGLWPYGYHEPTPQKIITLHYKIVGDKLLVIAD